MKRIPFKFMPLEKFEWYRDDTETLVGLYHPGMTYNCTEEPRHDMLFEMCKQWKKEKKIKIIPLIDEGFITITVGGENDDST